MVFIGIDPGFSGGIAIFRPSIRALNVYDMPVAPNSKGKTEINLYELHDVLEREDDSRHIAVVEQVAAMRGQGVSSMFRFGQGFGAIQMSLAAHKIETRYVVPSKWKSHFNLSRDKGVSRSVAAQRFPEYAEVFARVKDDGRAEACLLALYGSEVFV
jgi:crossover junction endodeoxyribonuclease RuvC